MKVSVFLRLFTRRKGLACFKCRCFKLFIHQQNHSHLHGYPTSSTGIQKRSVVYKFIPTWLWWSFPLRLSKNQSFYQNAQSTATRVDHRSQTKPKHDKDTFSNASTPDISRAMFLPILIDTMITFKTRQIRGNLLTCSHLNENIKTEYFFSDLVWNRDKSRGTATTFNKTGLFLQNTSLFTRHK